MFRYATPITPLPSPAATDRPRGPYTVVTVPYADLLAALRPQQRWWSHTCEVCDLPRACLDHKQCKASQ